MRRYPYAAGSVVSRLSPGGGGPNGGGGGGPNNGGPRGGNGGGGNNGNNGGGGDSTLPSPVAALASNAGNHAAGIIGWDTETYDVGGWHSTSVESSKFIVPATVSFARFGAQFFPQAGQTVEMQSLLNGNPFVGMAAQTGSTTSRPAGAMGAIVPVNASDHFQASAVGSIAGTPNSWAFVEAIDPTLNRVLLYKSGTQALGTNVNEALTFDLDVYDTNGFHAASPSPTRITIPADGVYRFGGQVQVTGNAGDTFLQFYKNGALITGLGATEEGYPTGSHYLNVWSAPLVCAQNDYFELIVLHSVAGGVAEVQGTWFTCEEIPSFAKRALANTNAAQSIGGNVLTAKTFQVDVYDTNGIHDTATLTSRFVTPKGVTRGRVVANIVVPNNIHTRSMQVRKNGQPVVGGGYFVNFTAGSEYLNVSSAWIPVVQGDYLEAWVASSSSITISSNLSNWCSAEFR